MPISDCGGDLVLCGEIGGGDIVPSGERGPRPNGDEGVLSGLDVLEPISVARTLARAVSYTHLTLPTIYSV